MTMLLSAAPPYVFDLRQIFFGDHPPIFLAEIILRTVVIYLYTLVLVRLIGKRGLGQMSAFDFLIVIALGSAVGDPMFYPEVPLAHAMAVITVVVALQRGVSYVTEKSTRAQTLVEGDAVRLVRDGVIDCERLAEEQLQREELFSSLRLAGITQLGQVARAYIEPSGHISVLKRASPRPGRPLMPACDPDPPTVYACGATPPEGGDFACAACGFCITLEAVRPLDEACPHCGHTEWLRAVEA